MIHEHILLEVGSNCFYIYYPQTVLSDTCVAPQYGLKNRGIWTPAEAPCRLLSLKSLEFTGAVAFKATLTGIRCPITTGVIYWLSIFLLIRFYAIYVHLFCYKLNTAKNIKAYYFFLANFRSTNLRTVYSMMMKHELCLKMMLTARIILIPHVSGDIYEHTVYFPIASGVVG